MSTARPAQTRRIPPLLWVVFILVDIAIVGAILAAVFWVAPTPPALGQSTTLAEARAASPGGLVVAVATSDSCLSCQMYKRGALRDERIASWISENAGAVLLVRGTHDADIAAAGVERIPATVVLSGERVVAVHYGAMSAADLLAFLERAAAPEASGSPAGSPVAQPDPESPAGVPSGG